VVCSKCPREPVYAIAAPAVLSKRRKFSPTAPLKYNTRTFSHELYTSVKPAYVISTSSGSGPRMERW